MSYTSPLFYFSDKKTKEKNDNLSKVILTINAKAEFGLRKSGTTFLFLSIRQDNFF